MGDGVSIRCNHCQNQEDFGIGSGMTTYMPFIKHDSRFDENSEVRKAIEIWQNTENVRDVCSYQLCVCPECKRIKHRLYIELFLDEKLIFQSNYTCRKHNKAMT